MSETTNSVAARIGGYAAIGAAVCAITGAALWGASGADLDQALVNREMGNYLTVAGANQPLLVMNLVVWIAMALLFGVAGTAMTLVGDGRSLVATLARYVYWTGVPLAVTAFVAWLALVLRLTVEPGASEMLVADVVGWFASRVDWLATILLVGVGPAVVSIAGDGRWVPRWLWWWSMGAAGAGVLTAVAMLTGGSGLSTYGFVVVPMGAGWTLAAGVVLLRWRGSLAPGGESGRDSGSA